jgi:hypothetical protein
MGMAGPSVLLDLDTVLFCRALDPPLDRFDFVRIVLRGVVLVVDIAPCRTHVLRGVDRILVVHLVSELYIAILLFAFRRVNVIPPVNLVTQFGCILS